VTSTRGAKIPVRIRADVAWMNDASCRGAPVGLFYPVQGGSASREHRAAALAFCGACPVTAECLAYALNGGEEGTWGGLTEAERKTLVRNARRREATARKREERQADEDSETAA
jgi:WhiB family redox-sensing transcriptional regulator